MISSGSTEKSKLFLTGGRYKKLSIPIISGQLKLRGQRFYPTGRYILILFTEEKSHAIALSLNKGVYIGLAQTFYPVSKSVLKSVDFLHIINAFTCFVTIDLYCNLNEKFKDYKLLLLLQRQIMVPPVFFKLVPIVRAPMSPVSNGSYRSAILLFITLKRSTCPISLNKIL